MKINIKISKEWKIFLLFLTLFALLTRPSAGLLGNDSARMAAIQSLVEYGSFQIDNSIFIDTVDKYLYAGHFYTEKPPIQSIYGAGFYFLLKNFGISFSDHQRLTYYLLTLLVVGVLTSIGLVYFYRTIKLFEVSEKWANVLLLITGTGTLLLPYSTVFNNHTVSAALLMIGFYYLFKVNDKLHYAFLSGLFIALAGSNELVVFLFIPLCTIVLFDKPVRAKVAFILACVPVIAVYFFLNFYTSGSFTPPAMNAALWNYPGSAFNEHNLSGLAYHSNISDLLEYAFHMLVGNRGLISYTPILVFSMFGFVKVLFKPQFKYRREYIVIILGSLVSILFYIFRSNNYSGDSYGVRWYVNLMFLLCLPLAHIGDEVKNSKLIKTLFSIVASLSILISFVGIIRPFTNVDANPSSFISCLIYAFQPPTTGPKNLYPSSSLMHLRVFIIAAIASLACYQLFRFLDIFCKEKQQ